MRIAFFSLAIIALANSPHAAEITARSKIDAVTVFPYGAEVVRTTTVTLDKGAHVLVLPDLPVRAIPRSIRVEGRGSGQLEIGAIDTRHIDVARSDEAAASDELRRLESEQEKLIDERNIVEGQILAGKTQKDFIAKLIALPDRPKAGDGAAVPEDWQRILTLIATGTADAVKIEQEAQIRKRDLDRRIDDLNGKIDAHPARLSERREARVHVIADRALDAQLTIRYQVRNAWWVPLYDARLNTGGKDQPARLELIRRASITQRTEESWDGVSVTLSTSRPNAGTAVPELDAVSVAFLGKDKSRESTLQSNVKTPSTTANPDDEEDPDKEGLGAVGPGLDVTNDWKAKELVAKAETLPFQAAFALPGRMTILSTSQASSVKLSEDAMEVALSVRSVPKLDAKAYLYAKLMLPQGSPVLPGDVALFRDGTYIGRGQLPALSSGEAHDLGFGVDDRVRVRYAVLEDQRGQTGLISSSKTDTQSYRVSVKNLHPHSVRFQMFDRIPISKEQDVRIERTGAAPTSEDVDDKPGLCVWESQLSAGEEKIFEYGYRISWPAEQAIDYSN